MTEAGNQFCSVAPGEMSLMQAEGGGQDGSPEAGLVGLGVLLNMGVARGD